MAFVRAVMVGRESLDRQVLLDTFERAGAVDARSHISTGNVSFVVGDAGGSGSGLDGLVDGVESRLEQLLGRPTPVYVRSLDDLVALLDADRFAAAPFDEVHARLVTFCRDRVPTTIELPWEAPNGDWSVFDASERELFGVTRAWPDRQPQDPGGVVQRRLGEPVTTRALGTIERIVARLDSAGTRTNPGREPRVRHARRTGVSRGTSR